MSNAGENADDIALVVDKPFIIFTEIVTNDCLGRISKWFRLKSLTLAAAKAESNHSDMKTIITNIYLKNIHTKN